MMQKDKRKTYIELFVLTLAVFFSIIPHVGVAFRFAGITWTAYRLFVVLSIVFLIVSGRICLQFQRNGIAWKWILFLVIWIAYGVFLLFVSKYADRHEGLIELMSIFNGLVICILLKTVITTERQLEFVVKLIFGILTALVLVAVFEIITAYHLTTSGFHDPESWMYSFENKHLASGFMYNINDFSALISCLSPVVVSKVLKKYKWAVLAAVIVINVINDAVTCNLALILFFVLYFFVALGWQNRGVLLRRTLMIAVGMAFLLFVVLAGRSLANQSGMLGSLARKIFAAQEDQGTIVARGTIYLEGVRTVAKGNLFGYGAASFPVYFKEHPSVTKLVNPHALLVEILVQYGLVILFVFLALIGMIGWRCLRFLFEAKTSIKKSHYFMLFGFLILYIIVSFAPSSFLGYAYPWMLVGLICTQLDLEGGRDVEIH